MQADDRKTPATCSACGACCNPVPFTREEHAAVTAWCTEALAAGGTQDPRTDDGWAWWMEHGWDYSRESATARFDRDGRWREDADFIAAHWTPRDYGEGCTCDMFDPATNLCTAQDTKPPVCRDYPWYSDEPTPERAVRLLPGCSYIADVESPHGPEDRALIPLAVAGSAA